jgi:UDP-glucose 4-epimerase
MKKVLITGAAGFIGGALAKKMIGQGFEVFTIDNLTTGFRDNIPQGVVLIEGSCQDECAIKKVEGYNFDAIFHIAGQSSGEISYDNPTYDLQSNTQSTLMLMKLALKTNCKKFIFASTMGVYGDQEDKPIDEESITFPKSFYSISKLASEHYMRIFQHYGLSTTALRLFNVYGPGQNMKNWRQGMVSIFLGQAIEFGNIHIKGNGERFRDIIYIDDVVNAFIAAYKSDRIGFNYYNVCTGEKTTINQLIGNIQKLFDKQIPIKFEGSTPGDQFGIYGDNSKIIRELSWEPQTNLEKGLKLMYKWAINNRS